MKYPHLLALGLAAFFVAVTVSVVTLVAHRYEAENERRTAELFFPQKINGSALQRLAFKLRHYLPIYGSSELGSYELQSRVKAKPGNFFITRPTGFMAFPVGRGGTTPLVMLQEIASVAAEGNSVRGHKVVIVLSPNWFTRPLSVGSYEGNATLLHTGGLLFGPFSPELKRDAARRLAEFPEPLAKSDLLRAADHFLAGETWKDRAMTAVLQPAGKSWMFFLRLMDDFTTVMQMRTRTGQTTPPPERRQVIHWAAEEADAEAISSEEAAWVRPGQGSGKTIEETVGSTVRRRRDVQFETSAVWGDFELLLRVLHESGAKALILSVPQDGTEADGEGVPYATRKVYYDKVHALAAKYGYPARTFEEHEYDGNFLIEHVSHLTEKGWLYLDQTIDAFYHGTL